MNPLLSSRTPFSSPLARRTGTALVGAFLLFPVTGCKNHKFSLSALMHHRRAKSKPNSTEYSDNLQQIVTAGQSSMLKWDRFTEDQPIVQQFYDDRDWELAWTRDGKPTKTTTALIQMFTDADKKGLRPEDYDGQRWQDHLRALTAAPNDQNTVAQFDVAVTEAAVRYLSDLHLGRINPQSLNFDIDVPAKRQAFNIPELLNDQLVDADDVASVVASVEPQNPMYQKTEDMLPHYLELAEKVAAQPQPVLPEPPKPIGPGGSYPAMDQLAQRLALEGDGTPQPSGNQYTPDFVQAVQHFQARVGLNPDGKLNKDTVDALNVPMSVRVLQIDDALEKWRWLPEPYQKPRFLVNLPEFYVRAFNPGGDEAFKMKVVDGQAKDDHNTPVFVREMKYLIFRPYWNLPPDIVKKDLLKHVGSHGYLESHGYEVVGKNGQPVSGWSVDDLEHARYLVRQKPGPKNSLGLVKFMFPNEYDIYMHSTPEMNLFNLYRRDRSHGCVRLNDAEKVADWVLEGQGDWDAGKIHEAMYGQPLNGDDNNAGQDPSPQSGDNDVDSGPTSTNPQVKDNKQVNLKAPLPVVITYLTANADEDGTMHFFDDIYEYDKNLNDALAQPRPYERKTVKINPKLAAGGTE